MAYPCYGWSDNEQATGPDVIPMTVHVAGYNEAIEQAKVWHNAYEGAVAPADLMNVAGSGFVYDALVQDVAITKQPSHQADQVQQPQGGESHVTSLKHPRFPTLWRRTVYQSWPPNKCRM